MALNRGLTRPLGPLDFVQMGKTSYVPFWNGNLSLISKDGGEESAAESRLEDCIHPVRCGSMVPWSASPWRSSQWFHTPLGECGLLNLSALPLPCAACGLTPLDEPPASATFKPGRREKEYRKYVFEGSVIQDNLFFNTGRSQETGFQGVGKPMCTMKLASLFLYKWEVIKTCHPDDAYGMRPRNLSIYCFHNNWTPQSHIK